MNFTRELAHRPAMARVVLGVVLAWCAGAQPVMALDLAPLWDHRQPAESERRFQQALLAASGDDTLILKTQIARTHGLRGDFARARQLLGDMAPAIAQAGAEARARHALEWGRTYSSAAHPPETQTPEARREARARFEQALKIARTARLDDIAIDALHMLAFVDTAPADQLRWGHEALALATASEQPAARRWEPSLRHNVGYALHRLGRHDEALAQFSQALSLRERGSDAAATRVARWMVAWTLRSLGRLDEALALQLRLEREGHEANAPDPYVHEELEAIYRALGNDERAAHYARLSKAR